MTLVDHRSLFGKLYPKLYKESIIINKVSLDSRFYYGELTEVPGEYPYVSKDIILSTTSNLSNGIIFSRITEGNPGDYQYRTEGSRVYVLSKYAGETLHTEYYGIGDIVQASDVGSGGGGSTPGGVDSSVQFNNGGIFDGSENLTWNNITNRLIIDGQIQISGGSPGTNRVLTSDAFGLATWESLPDTLTLSGNNGEFQFKLNSDLSSTSSVSWDIVNSKFVLSGGFQYTNGTPGLNKVITSDATGNATWEDAQVSSPAGNNAQIQYNDNGSFGASSDFTFTTGANNSLALLGTLSMQVASQANNSISMRNEAHGTTLSESFYFNIRDNGETRITYPTSGSLSIRGASEFLNINSTGLLTLQSANAGLLLSRNNVSISDSYILGQFENNGDVNFSFTNTSDNTTWDISATSDDFRINEDTSSTPEFILSNSGNITITGDIILNRDSQFSNSLRMRDVTITPTATSGIAALYFEGEVLKYSQSSSTVHTLITNRSSDNQVVINTALNIGNTSALASQLNAFSDTTSASGTNRAYRFAGRIDPSGSATSATFIGNDYSTFSRTSNANDIGSIRAFQSAVQHAGSGNVDELNGFNIIASNTNTGTVTDAYCYRGNLQLSDASGMFTNAYFYYATQPVLTGTATNVYGFYVGDLDQANITNAYGVYQEGSSDRNIFNGPTDINNLLLLGTISAPAGNPSGGGWIYFDGTDFKGKKPNGTVVTLG